MSSSQSARPKDGSPVRSTREMLDELDRLMDQMLALPVVDQPVSPPAPPVRHYEIGADLPTQTALEPRADTAHAKLPLPRSAPAALTATLTIIESDSDPIPISRIGFPPESEIVEVDGPVDEISPSSLLPDEPIAKSVGKPRALPPSAAAWTFRSAILWDRGFRRTTRRLGLFGGALRSSVGRMLLGVAGVASLAAALGWLIRDWLQWAG